MQKLTFVINDMTNIDLCLFCQSVDCQLYNHKSCLPDMTFVCSSGCQQAKSRKHHFSARGLDPHEPAQHVQAYEDPDPLLDQFKSVPYTGTHRMVRRLLEKSFPFLFHCMIFWVWNMARVVYHFVSGFILSHVVYRVDV